jgi:hypothetical protein
MGHRDTLLCDTTYRNATTARSAARECVRRSHSGFVQVGFSEAIPVTPSNCQIGNYSVALKKFSFFSDLKAG